MCLYVIFQSTLPARGATFSFRRVAQLDLDFNPRSPHGERLPPTCARNLWRNFNPRSPHGERQDRAFLNRRIEISIHAPRTGSDDGRGRKKRSKNLISIHAPRTGSDFRRSVKGFPPKYFNPRSPHGERRRQEPLGTVCPEISIHAPSTGSDRWDRPKTSGKGISIHAPRTGSDKRRPVARRKPQTFQSTLPARGATLQRDYHGALDVVFQSTLPARGASFVSLSIT